MCYIYTLQHLQIFPRNKIIPTHHGWYRLDFNELRFLRIRNVTNILPVCIQLSLPTVSQSDHHQRVNTNLSMFTGPKLICAFQFLH